MTNIISRTIDSGLADRGLPKWPMTYVTGVPVGVQRAKEIIRRTDSFFSSPATCGNDRAYNQEVKRLLGIAYGDSYSADAWTAHDAWKSRWGFVETEYVRNDWISCSFIGGPHGWCHPTGDIGFVDNVGKYPDVNQVAADWQRLAEAFPFLDVAATLMDRESSEEGLQPVVTVRAARGNVTLLDPHKIDAHASHPPGRRSLHNEGNLFDLDLLITMQAPARLREHGIPWDWIEEWAVTRKELV